MGYDTTASCHFMYLLQHIENHQPNRILSATCSSAGFWQALNIFRVIKRHYESRETSSKIVLRPHSSLCKLLYHRTPRLTSSWSVQQSVPRFFCCMTRCQKSRAWLLQPAFLFEACLEGTNWQKLLHILILSKKNISCAQRTFSL